MPLIRIDVLRGRTDAALALLLDVVHDAMLAAFRAPVRDRYQLVTEHEPSRMVVQDTGLDIPRTRDVVVVQVFTRPRTRDEKQAFYRLLAGALEARCGIAPSDLVVSCTSNTDEDWSFGFGRAQFLTGEL